MATLTVTTRPSPSSDPQNQPGGLGNPSPRLYVGNLSYRASWQDLKDLFNTVGPVVRADIMMMSDGRSKGCGIVEMATVEAATAAINQLHDTDLLGRPIFVRYDKEEPRSTGGRQLFVQNLPYRTSWQDLKDLMRACGDVIRADVKTDFQGYSKGCGTVLFRDEESAQKAIEKFNDYELEGRRISVVLDKKAL